ncbi:MAG TPA: hypothetical protein DDW50_02830 [Firmicutes bacterium]|jgi:hypothetical protein|nr:hypothetical protein [Bacillota bacterium]
MRGKILFVLVIIGLILSMSSLSFAETSGPIIASGNANPVSATEIQIPANLPVVVKTTQELTTHKKAVNVGDGVDLAVAKDVTVDGRVVIRAGAKAHGKVNRIEDRAFLGTPAQLSLEVVEVNTVDNQWIPVYGFYIQSGKGKNDLRQIITASLATSLFISGLAAGNENNGDRNIGLVGGFVVACSRGGDAFIAAGTEIKAITKN